MTFFLIYGNDATGKSVHCKAICDMAESAVYVMLEMKDTRLLEGSGFDVIKPLVLTDEYKIDPIPTFNKVGEAIQKIVKENKYEVVVIDGISDFPRWAEKVVIQQLQKKNPDQKVIGEKNLAGWAARNNLAALPVEKLAMWAEVNNRKVFATTLMTDEYIGEKKVGRTLDAKDRVRKAADVRVMLTHDGRGRLAKFEKVPGWSIKGEPEIAIKNGELGIELMKRGLL